jgi:hypothetical protein
MNEVSEIMEGIGREKCIRIKEKNISQAFLRAKSDWKKYRNSSAMKSMLLGKSLIYFIHSGVK